MTIRAVVGIKEPDPRVYRLTAERIGVEPYEIAFLDNSQSAVDGALAVGWRESRPHTYKVRRSFRDPRAQPLVNYVREGTLVR